MNITYTLGRILLSLVFIVAGIEKIRNVGGIAKMLEDNKIPIPDQILPYLAYVGNPPKYEALGYLVAGVELVGGLMVLAGLWARWGALMLAVFTAVTIVVVHNFWSMEGAAYTSNMTQALKNLSIIGGLLLVFTVGSSPGAMDRR